MTANDTPPTAGTTVAADTEAVAGLLREALAIADASGRRPARIALAAGGASVEVDWSHPAASQLLASTGGPAAVIPPDVPAGAPAVAVPPAVQPGAPAAAQAGADDGAAEPGTAVESPLVGTFYRAPSPEADPFVSVGDVVEEGQTIAIVEAMKLMNTITAPERGRVSAILAEDGDRVEFGQPLVRLVPLGTDAA